MRGWVLVTGDFVPHGGMDRANLELASFLASDRPVHLVTHRAAEQVKNLPNVTVHRVPRPFGRNVLGQPLLAYAGRRWASRLAGEGYRVVVNGGNCRWNDANWVHYVHAAYRPDVKASRLQRAKTRVERPFALRAERSAVGRARVVVCNSNVTRRDVVERLGVDPRRAQTVYYGVDPEGFRPATREERSAQRARLGWRQEQPIVFFVGALGDRRKGFDVLFSAWQTLCRESSWDALLVVVGRGAELGAWEARAAAAGVAGQVRFLGFRHDVLDLVRAGDALVHPARYEPYGLGVHEALCCGLPAVVSAAAGVSERYPHELAELILAYPESSAELAGRLRYWRANAEALSARVRPFSDELRSRTWTDMARDIRDAVLGT